MLKITSPVFLNNGLVPEKYACMGSNVNPLLAVENIPAKAESLAVIVDDPDAPRGVWTHWLVWNINPKIKEIKENTVPDGGVVGTNDFGKTKYDGPCPPTGTHRYFFKVYALDTCLDISAGSNRKELEKAMENHVLDAGELMGRYSR